MADSQPKSAPAPNAAHAKPTATNAVDTVVRVSLSGEGSGTQTVHVRPHDTVKIQGAAFEQIKVDILGSDVIFTMPETGQRLIMPGLGLFLFSSEEAPSFYFSDTPITNEALLAKVGIVVNLTEKDFVSFTSLDINALDDKQYKDAHRRATDEDSPAPAQQIVIIERPESQGATSEAGSYDADELLAAREELLSNAVGRPSLPAYVPPSSAPKTSLPEADGFGTVRTTFDFDARLLQVAPREQISGSQYIVFGGGGSAVSTFNPGSSVQFSTEQIDRASITAPTVIYADDPTKFSATMMSRVLEVSPNLPNGFVVTDVLITGLPAGFTLVGATYDAVRQGYVLTDPSLNQRGDIDITLSYTDLNPQIFSISIVATAQFDPNSQLPAPQLTTLGFQVDRTIAVREVNSADDYNYTDILGKPGWVLATNPNDNKIIGGDGGVTVYGGIGQNDVVTGSGADTITGGVSADTVNAGAGNDLIMRTDGNDTVDGGAGSDTVNYASETGTIIIDLAAIDITGYSDASIGSGKTDRLVQVENIVAGTGNDALSGNSFANNLSGGDGDDVITGRDGNDTLAGGAGTDTLSYDYADSGLTVDLQTTTVTAAAGDTDSISGLENVIGSNFNDNLLGTVGVNVLQGGGGNDTLSGRGGGDVLDGGSGNNWVSYAVAVGSVILDLSTATDGQGYRTVSTAGDADDRIKNIESVIGSSFADTITGDSANNTVLGGGGADIIATAGGDDVVRGEAGNDTMDGGTGTNTLTYAYTNTPIVADMSVVDGSGYYTLNLGAESDLAKNFAILRAGGGADTITGDNNANVIYGGTGADTLTGGAGNDTLYGEAGVNVLSGGANDDTLIGGDSGNTLSGNDGNDVITGGTGTDTVDGGLGVDAMTGGGGTDTLTWQSLTGGNAIIRLDLGNATDYQGSVDTYSGFSAYVGTNNGDTITLSAGTDTVTGGTGADLINANTGTHVLNGGTGIDTLSFAAATGAVVLNLATTTAQNSGYGTYTITALSVENVTGSGNDDTITGDNNANVIYGGTGADTLTGGAGNDTLYGEAGVNVLSGGANDDTLIGGDSGNTLSGNDGNDVITGGTGTDTVDGGLGVDAMTGGGGTDTLTWQSLTGGNAIIRLDLGNATDYQGSVDTYSGFSAFVGTNNGDTITLSTGTDTVTGGTGADLVNANTGTHVLNGGTGTDTLSFAAATGAVVLNLATTTAQNSGYGTYTITALSVENVTGSGNNDTITGDANANILLGGGGDDTLVGAAGNDTLDGEGGTNTVSYAVNGSGIVADMSVVDGGGYFTVVEGSNSDLVKNIAVLFGTNFADTVTGDANDNIIQGAGGNDDIRGGQGNDTLDGGAGNNLMRGEDGADIITGSSDNDTIYGGLGNDTMIGGGGTDVLRFDDLSGSGVVLDLTAGQASYATDVSTDLFSGFSTYVMTNQADTLVGSTGNDTVQAMGGDDLLQASLGTDSLDGGSGTDTFSYAGATGAVTLDLAATGLQFTGFGIVAVSNIENITGSAFNDTLSGDGNANILLGGDGLDTLVGGAGNDTLDGEAGNDLLNAGLGSDTIIGGSGTNTLTYAGLGGGVIFDLAAGTTTDYQGSIDTYSGIATLIGSDSGNTVATSAGDDVFIGGLGNDTFIASLGNDTFDGAAGSDTITYVNATGAVTLDLSVLTAQATGYGTITLTNVENITGSDYDDTLVGDAAANVLLGGLGNDTVSGGDGNDTMDGQGGINTVTYAGGSTGIVTDMSVLDGAGYFMVAQGANSDRVKNFAVFIGTGLADTITGDGSNNTVYGGSGADIIATAGGDDLVQGDAGNDTMDGGTGTNTLTYAYTNTPIVADMGVVNGGGYYTLNLGAESDQAKSFAILVASGGADTITGDNGANIIYAGTGNDTISGGSGADTIFGEAGVNVLSGDGSNDVIVGGDDGNTITGGLGDDTLTGGTGTDTVDGGLGVDAMTGGGGTDTLTWQSLTGGNAIIRLDLGNATDYQGSVDTYSGFSAYVGTNNGDTITLSAGTDTVTGGTGADLVNANTGTHVLNGGTGTDTLSFAAATGAVVLNLATTTAQNSGYGTYTITALSVENVTGSANNDTITGDANANILLGGGGDDTLVGAAGNDTLDGEGGTNTVSYGYTGTAVVANMGTVDGSGYYTVTLGAESDKVKNIATFIAGTGNDTITGDNNANVIYGGTGADTLTGGAGNDTLYGEAGVNVLSGGANDDTLIGGDSGNTLSGNDGNDVITGGTGTDTVDGGLGVDAMTGGGGTDTLTWQSLTGGNAIIRLDLGNATDYQGSVDTYSGFSAYVGTNNGDTITLSAGTDTVTGGTGADLVNANTGTHVLNGGTGTDTLSFAAATGAVVLNLATTTAQNSGYGTYTITALSVENVTGSANNDTITGDANANILLGGGGDDTLVGAAGNDTLDGEGGTNTVSYGYTGTAVVANMGTVDGSGYYTVTLGAESDKVKNIATFIAGTGNDTITGDNNANVIYGGTGADTLTGGAGNDTLYGEAGVNVLSGGANDDTLIGGDSGNTLSGNDGNDVITGGTGTDTVDGGLGVDAMTGGGGTDTLTWQSLTGGNAIIRLDLGNATDYQGSVDTYSGFSAYVGTNNGDTITLSAGTDTVTGGTGADLVNANTGTHVLNGGTGTDTLSFAAATGAVVLNLATTTAQNSGYGTYTITALSVENVTGSANNDTITGDANANILLGGGGDDTLVGAAGNDTLDGEGGTNTVSYGYTGTAVVANMGTVDGSGYYTVTLGAESDKVKNIATFIAGTGNDTITGDNNANVIYGGTGADTLTGGAGNDTLYGEAGVNVLSGGANDDTLIGGDSGNTLSGNDGNDVITGGTGTDTVDGGLGVDAMTGGGGTDTLTWQSLTGGNAIIRLDLGNATDYQGSVDTYSGFSAYVGTNNGDTITLSTGTDTVTGGTGADLVNANTGTHVLNGGTGTDTLSFAAATGAVVLNLATTTAQNSGYGTYTITALSVENVTGSANNDTITGDANANILLGGGGDDTLVGAAGNDTLDGEGGTNTVSYGYTGTAVVANMGTVDGSGYYTVTLGAESDKVKNIATFIAGTGNDTITGDNNANVIYGGTGADTLTGGAGNDTLYGEAGVNVLSGGANDDTLIGGDSGNTLSGNDGNDVITGGTGTDTVDGGLGVDAMTGGGGTDTLTWQSLTGGNAIIRLDLGNATDYQGSVDTYSGFSAYVGTNNGDTITLSAGTDTVTGGTGADLINANTGTHVLNGGTGIDTLSFAAATGAVVLNLATTTAQNSGYGTYTITALSVENVTGSGNNDTITGNTGNNILRAGAGTNILDGGAGNDTLYGDTGTNNILNGGANNDTIFGGTGADTIDGGLGADVITGGGGTDTLTYAAFGGLSTIRVDLGNSTDFQGNVDTFSGISNFIGTNHFDEIYLAASGTASVTAGTAGASFYANTGTHILNGGGYGYLSFFYVTTASIVIDLSLTTAQASGYGTYSLTNFNDMDGGSLDDTLTGTNGINYLGGNDGNDTLAGLDGTDFLYGGEGNDVANGGNDNDELSGENGNDTLNGDDGNDTIYGGAGNDVIDGGAGTGDWVIYNTSSALVVVNLQTGTATGEGTDTLTNIENIFGSLYNDTLTGDGGDNYILGYAGNDTLEGGTGNDTVDGGAGNDIFIGGTGNDTITGGTNNDIIDFTGYANALNVNLQTRVITKNGGTDGSDTYTTVEGVYGGSNNDSFSASTAQGYTIRGGFGNDTFAAANSIYSDVVDGGNGTDFANYGALGSVTGSFAGSSGSVSKAAGGIDTLNNVEQITTGSSADTFTLDTDSLGTFTSLDMGAGSDTIRVIDTPLAATDVGATMAGIFSNVETLDLRSMTNAGDTFGSINGDQIFAMLGALSTLTLQVTAGSNLANNISFTDGATFISHVTVGNTTTWSNAGATQQVVLQIV